MPNPNRFLLIDDVRSFNVDVIARNYFEGIWELEHHGPWFMLYLDHDLGEPWSFSDEFQRHMTGYDVLCWLEEHPQFLPKSIVLVTDNPVGREKMKQVLIRLHPEEK